MRRYHITLGALTTANGQVVSASGRGSIDGKQAVLEGDKIMCRACKSTGYVLCVGPRIPETWDGKQVALQGDLCICKCSSPPQLIANQSLSYQTIEEADLGGYVPTNDTPPMLDSFMPLDARELLYDEHFVLIDKRTGEVQEDWGYRIHALGQSAEGATDSTGKTGRVGSDEPEKAIFDYAHQTKIGI